MKFGVWIVKVNVLRGYILSVPAQESRVETEASHGQSILEHLLCCFLLVQQSLKLVQIQREGNQTPHVLGKSSKEFSAISNEPHKLSQQMKFACINTCASVL